jgi:transcriptional regulator with XRE-family HTH domain
MRMDSGRVRLAEWLGRARVSYREIARQLGVHHTTINQILTGRRTPGLALAAHIERITGIPAASWVATEGGTDDLAPTGTTPISHIGRR